MMKLFHLCHIKAHKTDCWQSILEKYQFIRGTVICMRLSSVRNYPNGVILWVAETWIGDTIPLNKCRKKRIAVFIEGKRYRIAPLLLSTDYRTGKFSSRTICFQIMLCNLCRFLTDTIWQFFNHFTSYFLALLHSGHPKHSYPSTFKAVK